MLNGTTGAGAVCCQYAPENGNAGYGVNTKPVNVGGGVQVNVPRSPGGLLSQVGQALNQAIHGGDSLAAQQFINSAARSISGGGNVVPFPVVNPFKPVLQSGAPVTGLNRFPNRFTRTVESTGSEPDDEQSSLDGLGAIEDIIGPAPLPPIYVPRSSGPSTLQTILGTIQGTLPATIQAIRAQPSNIFPGTTYNPYTTNYPGAVYPGSVPATTGPAAGVGAGVGSAVDTLGGTISRFVVEHPYLVIGGGAALFLLFMNPPRRR